MKKNISSVVVFPVKDIEKGGYNEGFIMYIIIFIKPL